MREIDESLTVIQASGRASRWTLLLVAALIFSLPVFSVLFSTRQFAGTIVLACLILTLEGALVFPSLALARRGREVFSKPVLWLGIFLIVGGIWFDVLSTVWNTPDMMSEGNPFIIFMRENGFPLWSMYLVGFYAQAALTVISVSLWTAFMRHWRVYLDGLLALRPQTFLEYLFAAFGGSSWYAKTNHLRVSRSYRFLWLPVLIQIVPFDRWELGLEWMGLLPP